MNKLNDYKLLMEFSIVVATDKNNGISRNDTIPWFGTEWGKKDLRFFKDLTTITNDKSKQNVVIMGRKTWDSLPNKPLKNRVNIILSKHTQSNISMGILTSSPTIYMNDLSKALDWCKQQVNIEKVFVIGGEQVYNMALYHPLIKYVYMTVIPEVYNCDKFFTVKHFVGISRYHEITNGPTTFLYTLANKYEQEYLNLLKYLLNQPLRPNRTGVKTYSSFGHQLKFSLYNEETKQIVLPAISCRRIPLKTVFHELVWFLSGKDNIDYLTKNNVHIWDGNTTREFLDSRGLHDYAVGDTGPIYGVQWRNWNNEGIDQIRQVINMIKTDPWSRRLLVSAWNLDQLDKMCLPPCHYGFQFFVDTNSIDLEKPKYLDCMVNLRSNDMYHGNPFNISSYSFLTIIIAQITGLIPRNLIMNLGDTHIYETHVEAVKTMLQREPRSNFPTLELSERLLSDKNLDIDDFVTGKYTFEDFKVKDYYPHRNIKMDMVV